MGLSMHGIRASTGLDSPLLTALPKVMPADMIGAMSSIPKWIGGAVALIGLTAWFATAWQIGLVRPLCAHYGTLNHDPTPS